MLDVNLAVRNCTFSYIKFTFYSEGDYVLKYVLLGLYGRWEISTVLFATSVLSFPFEKLWCVFLVGELSHCG